MEQEKPYKLMSREKWEEEIVKRSKIVKTPKGWRVPSLKFEIPNRWLELIKLATQNIKND